MSGIMLPVVYLPATTSRSDSRCSAMRFAKLVLPDPLAPHSNNGRLTAEAAALRKKDVASSSSWSTPANLVLETLTPLRIVRGALIGGGRFTYT
jgi:hypothetical protein